MRRGLPGELLLHLARLTSTSLVQLTAALQILLSAGFTLSLLPLLRRTRWSLASLALFLSPATLSFPVLDPPAAHRKEILLYLTLALLLNLLRHPRTVARPWRLAVFISAAVPALILSHEALLIYLPYIFAALFLALPRRTALAVSVFPAALGLLAVLAIALHPASLAQAAEICTSIGSTLHPDGTGACGGAILYLARTPSFAHADTLRAARTYHYLTRYPIPALLAVLPIPFIFRNLPQSRRDPSTTTTLATAAALAFLASSLLFYFARDWGRWLHIHLVCLLLLFLFANQKSDPRSEPHPEVSASRKPAHPQNLHHSRSAIFALLLYATCWTLPALGNYPGRFGYIDLARYLAGYRTAPHITR